MVLDDGIDHRGYELTPTTFIIQKTVYEPSTNLHPNISKGTSELQGKYAVILLEEQEKNCRQMLILYRMPCLFLVKRNHKSGGWNNGGC